MTDDNKPTIENPLKTGLRQRTGLGLSKKKGSSGETSEPLPLATGIFYGSGIFFLDFIDY